MTDWQSPVEQSALGRLAVDVTFPMAWEFLILPNVSLVPTSPPSVAFAPELVTLPDVATPWLLKPVGTFSVSVYVPATGVRLKSVNPSG